MSKGKLFFEISFADDDFEIPIVTTLIDLDASEVIDGVETHQYLVADQLLSQADGLQMLMLTDEQVSALLDASALIEQLRRTPIQIAVEKLADLGV